MVISIKDTPNAIRIASALIEITHSITHGAETVDIFSDLAQRCVDILPVAAAGILLSDASGDLRVIGSSSPAAHMLDLFQVQNDKGPCMECAANGLAVSDEELDEEGPWPRFSRLAKAAGFTAVYALPLKSRTLTVGALNLFAKVKMTRGQLTVAEALANSATLSLLRVDPEADIDIVVRRIHFAVESKNTVEQAQGMIAQRFSIDIEEAFVRLRKVSLETQLTLTQVATAVVQRDKASPVAQLL